ncbi:hypothetical protein [Acetobacter oeni]|uniref:hypothetical protein n=1 Tax=Acetobacter oeni TaxID=304077 RepID=UPI0011BF0809|nr:hypothetical protein [Acetobacter oeni]MBB3883815.1 hypothetical protein [Acetobacter oeni]NHO19843.1 hypothetical protein [Acetobacter oeni]
MSDARQISFLDCDSSSSARGILPYCGSDPVADVVRHALPCRGHQWNSLASCVLPAKVTIIVDTHWTGVALETLRVEGTEYFLFKNGSIQERRSYSDTPERRVIMDPEHAVRLHRKIRLRVWSVTRLCLNFRFNFDDVSNDYDRKIISLIEGIQSSAGATCTAKLKLKKSEFQAA